jgi:peptidyl-prolyl cis-trans isomerase D
MMLAFFNSDDSSAQQGGDLVILAKIKWWNHLMIVFNSSIGSIGLVETPFGFHIIKVTDKQDGIRLATVPWG